MLELKGLHDLQWLKDEAQHTDRGCEFRAFTEAVVLRFIPYSRSKFTYSGCSKYISELGRFCQKPVGKRKGLFQDEEDQTKHVGPCEKPGREFYHFRLEIGDESGSISAVIREKAAYLLGLGQPLIGSEFSRLSRADKESLLKAKLNKRFFFRIQFLHPWEGLGHWSVLEVSILPLHSLKTPSPCSSSSGLQSITPGSSIRVPQIGLPDGSPNRRLLGLKPGPATPPSCPYEDGLCQHTNRLISALDGLKRTSAAMTLSVQLLDAAVDDLSSFLETSF